MKIDRLHGLPVTTVVYHGGLVHLLVPDEPSTDHNTALIRQTPGVIRAQFSQLEESPARPGSDLDGLERGEAWV